MDITQVSCAVVCDIDGVLWNGGKHNPIPNASEAIQLLSVNQIPVIYVTNGGGKLESSKAADLTACLKCPVTPDQIVTSHTPMLHVLKGYSSEHVLFVGHDCQTIHEIAQFYGFTNYITLSLISQDDYISTHHYLVPWSHHYKPSPPSFETSQAIKAVIMLHEPVYWAEALQVLSDIFLSEDGIIEPQSIKLAQTQQIPLYVANPDFVYPVGFPVPRFTSGAFNMCLSELFLKQSGRHLKIEFYGKPLKDIYDFSKQILSKKGQNIKMIYAIGDNPLSDIKGANEASGNWFSILVRTGCWVGIDNDEQNPAKLVCDDVLDAVKFIIAQK